MIVEQLEENRHTQFHINGDLQAVKLLLMKQIAQHAHLLQRIYNLEHQFNRVFIANHYHFQESFQSQQYILMPLFGLQISNDLQKNSLHAKFIRSDTKKQELYNANTLLILSTHSDCAVYRTKTIYTKRDGIEQIIKHLALPNHIYSVHLNLLCYFLPQKVLYKQLLQALNQLQVLDVQKIKQITKIDQIIKIKQSSNNNIEDILFNNDEFIDMIKWRQLIKKFSIINMKTLHLNNLSQQISALYWLNYHQDINMKRDILKINKYLIENFDMFNFRYKLEHNEKLMKYLFLRMISRLQLNQELDSLLKTNIKCHSLEWNKQLIKELKSTYNLNQIEYEQKLRQFIYF